MKEKIQKALNKFKKNQNAKAVAGVAAIVILYVFFFNSKTIFKVKEKYKSTDINSQIELSDRTFTLEKWQYCENTKTMEVEFSIINKAYDGNDNYTYETVDRNGDMYDTSVMFTSPTLAVIRIYNVLPDFTGIRVAVNIDTGTKQNPAKFYASCNSVERVNEIKDYKDINEYYIAKLNRYIEHYEKEKTDIQKKIDDAAVNVKNLEDLITTLESQKKYAAADELNNINRQIADVNKQLISANSNIKSLQSDIKTIDEKIDDYKAIKLIYE